MQRVGALFTSEGGNKSETTITKNDYETIVMLAYISFGYGYVKENAWAWSIEGTVYFTNDELSNKVINGRTGIELCIFNNMIARAGVFTELVVLILCPLISNIHIATASILASLLLCK